MLAQPPAERKNPPKRVRCFPFSVGNSIIASMPPGSFTDRLPRQPRARFREEELTWIYWALTLADRASERSAGQYQSRALDRRTAPDTPPPQPSTPEAVAKVVAQVAAHFDWKRPIGCTFPAVVQNRTVYSAANVDKFMGERERQAHMFQKATGCPVLLINDGDAAGIAEMTYGAGKGRTDVVFMLWLSAPASAPPSSPRACCCPTPTREPRAIRGKDADGGHLPGHRNEDPELGRVGRACSTNIWAIWNGSSHPTCSSSEVGSARSTSSFSRSLKTQPKMVPSPILEPGRHHREREGSKDLVMPKWSFILALFWNCRRRRLRLLWRLILRLAPIRGLSGHPGYCHRRALGPGPGS